MAPNNQKELCRLVPSSPRTQEPVGLVDDVLRRDMEDYPQPDVQPDVQPVQPAQPDVQIVGVVYGTNEDQEVRCWKMFAGNVRWYTSTK